MKALKKYPAYMVSESGEVFGTDRTVKCRNGVKPVIGVKIKTRINHWGYVTVPIKDKGKSYTQFVHKLIAEAFIPNPENKPEINHIDGNKLNNSLENLEWCTRSENELHAYRTGLKGKKKPVSPNAINPVLQNL